MQMRPPHFFHNIVNMKHYLLIIVSLFTFSVSHAQFSSVSTNIVGWAAGNINAQYDQHSGLGQSVQVRRHPVEPCRPATGMAALVRRAIHRTVRLPLAVLCQLHHRLRQTHLQRQCLRHRMLLGLLETPEYPLELHRRDRGRYRLYPLHREAAAEAHRGVRRRVYLSSPPVPARPDQMQPVIFLLVLIHRSHDNDFRKLQRI